MLFLVHAFFLLFGPTWCADAQDPLVPANRPRSQRLVLASELNLSVAANLLIFQKNENLRRALPNRQRREAQRNQC